MFIYFKSIIGYNKKRRRNQKEGEQMENLTFLETELGPIYEIEQICPDVCYISAGSGECFAVSKDGPTISRRAKTYGKSLPDHPETLLYSLDKPDSDVLLNSFGAKVGLTGRPDRTIQITPGAGTAFLKKDVLWDG